MLSSVFPVVIGNVMGGGMVLHLWHTNPNLVLRGFLEAHNVNPANMTRILNICQEIKVKLGFGFYRAAHYAIT